MSAFGGRCRGVEFVRRLTRSAIVPVVTVATIFGLGHSDVAAASLSLTATPATVMEGDSFELGISGEGAGPFVQIFRDGETWPLRTCLVWNGPCATTYTGGYSLDGQPQTLHFTGQEMDNTLAITQQTSLDLTVQRRPVKVTLASSDPSNTFYTTDLPITLSAGTDYPSWNPFYLEIYDTDHQDPRSDSALTVCHAVGSPCEMPAYLPPGLHHYIAKVVSYSDGGPYTLASSPVLELDVFAPGAKIHGYNAVELARELERNGLCDQLDLMPAEGTHLTRSTLSDEAIACETAVQAGWSWGRIVAFINAGMLGLGLTHPAATTEGPVPHPPETPRLGGGTSTAPTPTQLSPSWPLEDLTDVLLAQNPDVLPQMDEDERRATITEVADECLWLEARAGEQDPEDECKSTPIFASGSDVAEATTHDLDALDTWPLWVRLNYEYGTSKPGSEWYKLAQWSDLYASAGCAAKAGDEDCDEYPFFASEQGGPLAQPTPHLAPIDADDNRTQGGFYNGFRASCGLTTGTLQPEGNSRGGSAFLAVPLPVVFQRPTFWLCNAPLGGR
jgi:hypothetical protein